MEDKIFSHYFFENIQISTFSYVYYKNFISDGANWTMKEPNIGTTQSKNQRNQCGFYMYLSLRYLSKQQKLLNLKVERETW